MHSNTMLACLLWTLGLSACASAVGPASVDASADVGHAVTDAADTGDAPFGHPTPCSPMGMACGDRDWCCGGYCDRADGGPGVCRPVPAGTFPCGSTYCASGTQYCELVYSDVPTPDSSTCLPIPPACNGTATCACVPQRCALSCSMGDVGAIVLQCLGG